MAASTAWAIWCGSFRARTTRRAKYMGPCAFARKIVGWGATFNSVCRASTTTPTISTGLGTVQQTFSFLPTGFWPAKNRSANAWLTTVALGVPKRSCWPKSRPLSMGVPMVWKYPGLITRKSALGEETFGSGPGAGAKQEPDTNPVSGRKCVEPAACTPGTLRTSSSTRSMYCDRFSRSPYLAGEVNISMASRCSVTKPGLTEISRAKTAHEQAGANQQQKRQRNLGDHERPPEDATASHAGALRTLLQRALKLRARDLNRGRQAKYDGRRQGNAERKEEHSGIQANRFHPGQRHTGGDHREQALEAPVAHCQTSCPSRQRQQQALR